MREILFRGQTRKKGEKVRLDGTPIDSNWIYGGIFPNNKGGDFAIIYQQYPKIEKYTVYANTVGQYTGLLDKNGKKIFEGDIVQYQTYDDFICTSVVKLGKYKQDGSSGEYNGIDCIGYYVEVIEFICPDWCDEDFCFFHEHLKTQNILEVAKECKVIGNIHDSPELLEVSK